MPFDVAHALDQHELYAYAIMFSKFENGDLEWDFERGEFIERAAH